MFAEIPRSLVAEARGRAVALGIPFEVVLSYVVSERRWPASVDDVEAWGHRPDATLGAVREDAGPWWPVEVVPSQH